jgi:hypothetical protein
LAVIIFSLLFCEAEYNIKEEIFQALKKKDVMMSIMRCGKNAGTAALKEKEETMNGISKKLELARKNYLKMKKDKEKQEDLSRQRRIILLMEQTIKNEK